MKAIFTRLVSDQRGTSAVEYGLILSMIVLAMLTALRGFANENKSFWTNISSKSADAVSAATAG